MSSKPFTPEEYDVLIAAAERYPAGYGFVYTVTPDLGDTEEMPLGVRIFLKDYPDAFC